MKIITRLLYFTFLFLTFNLVSADSTWSTLTEAKVHVSPWVVTIYWPKYLNFWSWEVQPVDQYVNVNLLTYSWGTQYFELEDLAWRDEGYHATISITDLEIAWTNNKIASENVRVTLTAANSNVTVMDWLFCWPPLCQDWLQPKPDEIVIPDDPPLSSVDFTIPLTIIKRTEPTTPHSWILGRYGLQPKFRILIPKYQPPWVYSSTITYTVVEL